MADIIDARYTHCYQQQQQQQWQGANQKSAAVPCKYRAGRVLGRGTYAEVKEMEHVETGQRFAGKVICKQRMKGHESTINNELHVLRHLPRKHPNLLTLVDYFETPHSVYLITELCRGGELFEQIRTGAWVMDERRCANALRQLLQGVRTLHEAGVVHRDLKPENCLLRHAAGLDALVIADFGMARIVQKNNYLDRPLTSLCGTPGYMAPEMLLRAGHGLAVDMWAVGVVACFMLTGSNPFHGDGQRRILAAGPLGLAAFLAQLWTSKPWVSREARHFISLLLQYDPVLRPTAAEALTHPWLAERQMAAFDCVGLAGISPADLTRAPSASVAQSTAVGRYSAAGNCVASSLAGPPPPTMPVQSANVAQLAAVAAMASNVAPLNALKIEKQQLDSLVALLSATLHTENRRSAVAGGAGGCCDYASSTVTSNGHGGKNSPYADDAAAAASLSSSSSSASTACSPTMPFWNPYQMQQQQQQLGQQLVTPPRSP
ncbi:Calcium/calmodulin-dependent protein kinase type I [Coemansia sp. Benny D115]|nr:Calcium/calmodulin-dependent protein kinase type I [Coemansia sp. Benny D115]